MPVAEALSGPTLIVLMLAMRERMRLPDGDVDAYFRLATVRIGAWTA
jgi:hypothetical protein